MVDHKKSSKTVVTMVDHGHHFAWEVRLDAVVGCKTYEFANLTLKGRFSVCFTSLLQQLKTGCSRRCFVRPLLIMEWNEVPKWKRNAG